MKREGGARRLSDLGVVAVKYSETEGQVLGAVHSGGVQDAQASMCPWGEHEGPRGRVVESEPGPDILDDTVLHFFQTFYGEGQVGEVKVQLGASYSVDSTHTHTHTHTHM